MPAGRFPPGSYPPDSRVLGGTQATQQQYRAVPAAPIRRQGGKPAPPGAPDYVPPVDDYAQAQALFQRLLGPEIASLNSLYAGRAKSGMDAIGGYTRQLAAALAPLAGQMQGIYGGAEQSQASSDAALRQALVGGGQGLADALSAKLGAINAPGAQISDVAGGQAQTGVGAGNAGFALGSAELGRLIGTGTAEQTFAAKQPGIAGFTGLQKAGELQQSLQSELADKIAGMQGQGPAFVQSQVDSVRAGKAAAAAQRERNREFTLNYNQRADIANQRAGLAKDKFKPQVGSDGSITAVYADGRVVKIAGPGTVPQAQRTGTWSTRITRDGSIVQSNGQTGAVRTVAGPNKAWASGTGGTGGKRDTLFYKVRDQAFSMARTLFKPPQGANVPAGLKGSGGAGASVPREKAYTKLWAQYGQELFARGFQRPVVEQMIQHALSAAGYPANPNQAGGAGRNTAYSGGPVGYPLGTRSAGLIGRPYQGTHTLYGNWESDNAIDIPAAGGTPVYAVADGTIGSQLGSLGKGGNLAGDRVHLVANGNEYYYAHLKSYVVKAGQRVKRGQLIGYTGALNHLHIASKNGNPVDIFGYGKGGAV